MESQPGRIRSLMAAHENEGPDKVCPLPQAIRTHVKPGMGIFLGLRANAVIHELLRQFWGTSPGFTLSMIEMSDFQLTPAHAGLARKVITSIVLGGSAASRTSPNFKRIMEKGKPEIELWTIYTMCQRLIAGGMGLPFFPTNSILGTSMAPDLEGSFLEIGDPFGTAQRVGLVKALRPDVAIIHVLAADMAGNAILAPEWQVETWAARAAQRGTIITTEKVVSTKFIREHAPLVKIPGYLVKAVCPLPFGGFPSGLSNWWVPGVESYAFDREFGMEYGRASQAGEEALNRWIKEWVLDCPSHEAFLDKVGHQRLEGLKKRAAAEMEAELPLPAVGNPEQYNDRELTAVAAARKIEEVTRKRDYRFIMVGVGISAPACFMAYQRLRASGYDLELAVGFGNIGFIPRSHNLGDPQHYVTSKMFGDMHDIYGSFLRGADSPSLTILGIGEIDKHGNINTTRLADGSYLTGSGGHQDCAAGAGETMVVATMAPHRFIDRVGYTTTQGDRVRVVVTDVGVLEKPGDGQELVLTSYFSTDSVSADEAIAKVKARCGWDLKVSPTVRREPPPTAEELVALRRLDPRRELLG